MSKAFVNEDNINLEIDLDSLSAEEPGESSGQPAGKNYITPVGLEKLRSELKYLFHDERPKLVQTIAWAASNGDRSENADYIYGKRRLREIDRRLRFLKRRLDIAEVVDPKQIKDDKIVFGATVTVEDEDGKVLTYQIVGEDESDPPARKISWQSPVAKALMGKEKGDAVIVNRPAGEMELYIREVQYK